MDNTILENIASFARYEEQVKEFTDAQASNFQLLTHHKLGQQLTYVAKTRQLIDKTFESATKVIESWKKSHKSGTEEIKNVSKLNGTSVARSASIVRTVIKVMKVAKSVFIASAFVGGLAIVASQLSPLVLTGVAVGGAIVVVVAGALGLVAHGVQKCLENSQILRKDTLLNDKSFTQFVEKFVINDQFKMTEELYLDKDLHTYYQIYKSRLENIKAPEYKKPF